MLAVFLPLSVYIHDYTSKDCLACILGTMAQRAGNKYMDLIRYNTDTMHSKFTGVSG